MLRAKELSETMENFQQSILEQVVESQDRGK